MMGPDTLPVAPQAGVLWRRTFIIVLIGLGLFLLDRLTVLLATYWFFEAVGLDSVFWTNLRAGVVLFAIGFVLFASAIVAPAYLHSVSSASRGLFRWCGMVVGLAVGYLFALHYAEFLPAFPNVGFGETDPIFGRDIGFYVFVIPAAWVGWWTLLAAAVTALISSASAAYESRRDLEAGATMGALSAFLGRVSSPLTTGLVLALGLVVALGVRLSRFNLLVKDNSASAIHNGAEILDITGVFSTLNYIHLTSFGVLGVAGGVFFVLRGISRGLEGPDREGWTFPTRKAALLVLAPIVLDLSFWTAVGLRNLTGVLPNEPVIQLDLIDRHIQATLEGYGLNGIEIRRFLPATDGDPLPTADDLLSDVALRNAPLWPGFVSKLERLIDPQHAERILQTGGDQTVYGPVLEIFNQEQKLRAYYDFMDVDAVRYRVDDEPRMYVSAVREIPLIEPEEWLAWWGQRFVLFTHGHGLVMAETSKIAPSGGPVYASWGLPARSDLKAVGSANPSIYYGEGAATMAYTNVEGMLEFDFPTDEGRAEIELPEAAGTGVQLNSLLRRMVFGWRSGQFFEIVFSRLIDDDTRVHYFRKPLERLARVAPFLYFDTDPYAVAADGRIIWIANALTSTDRYPYSQIQWLGDKSDERAPHPGALRRTNWVRDAVKATVDAYTGELSFYAISDDPILRTWASVYPDLFRDGAEIPPSVREHLQYPLQLFHIQFDDVFKLYHMTDPMTFFNMEDAWDDGDEVLGPIIDKGKAITFSIEPYHWIAETGGVLPESDRPQQFMLSMLFTPESSLNLRAIAYVYQDGADYGRLGVLQIPKGRYQIGPEQIDAAIDQDPEISQQITLWNRLGSDVIRGHTTAILVGNEVVYLEPLFIRSQQNPASQLKRVIAVIRGQPAMGETLEEAVRRAVARAQKSAGERSTESQALAPN